MDDDDITYSWKKAISAISLSPRFSFFYFKKKEQKTLKYVTCIPWHRE